MAMPRIVLYGYIPVLCKQQAYCESHSDSVVSLYLADVLFVQCLYKSFGFPISSRCSSVTLWCWNPSCLANSSESFELSSTQLSDSTHLGVP